MRVRCVWSCLSHATVVEFLEPSLWVALMYALREKEGEVVG